MEVACQEPVVIRGVRVRPGDWLLADGSGVVFVPAARLDEVLAQAESLFERERQMLERVRSGEPVGTVMNHQYENLLKGT